MLETFSKLASERVLSECRHCRLTSDIFIKEFFTGRQPRYIADIYLVVPALAWFVKTTYLKEESKSELNVMLEIGLCGKFLFSFASLL